MVVQSQEIPRVRLPPTSTAFTLLLGLLVALPSFGIDMSLPALTSVGAALGVAPERAGLMMSLFMLGFAVAPLFYGPVSDRYGRKPVVVFACTLFAIAGIGCAFARSLPTLLVWRVVQGAGAGASMTITLAIVRDLFEGQAARTRLSYVSIATMVVPTIAPSAGAALLALGGWRVIHAVLGGVGLLLLLAMLIGFTESARLDPANRLVPSVIARNYLRVLMNPLCLGYILINAAAFGALFAYVSGSSLFLINVVGLRPGQFGVVFAATSLGIMAGAFLNGRLSTWGVAPFYPLTAGLVLAVVTATALLLMTLVGWMPLIPVILILIVGNFAFGLIAPNAMQGAMQPLPQIAGAAGAATGCIQMATAAVVSGLVALLHDQHSALSMTALMSVCSLVALAAYLLLARPAERAIVQA
ncbi:MAG TPA: multidrug effflux MFS transporter [Bradyrhizobium sp.]|jgi:DHA1 family bicyclomycin/chloramphenicol resistance-like MFS transporter|nr:multidrug effflux MFS transporter [Bradyrhizobium sp.]